MASLPRSKSCISIPYPTSYRQFTVNDWMQAIRSPTPYRVGNARVHLKPRNVAYGAMFITAVLVLLVYFIPSNPSNRLGIRCNNVKNYVDEHLDSTYPLTNPLKIPQGTQFKIAIVTDLDTDSKSEAKSNTWLSYLKYGNLTISDSYNVNIQFDSKSVELTSRMSEGGRGMELSELVVFNGKLYTVDDRTGIVYEIFNNKVIPWVILTDGNGKELKGFKCEWATVKDGRLYVGGLGKEWTTTDGEVVNTNPQWVKSIGPMGDIQHHDWKDNYNALRAKAGTTLPGYMIHESCVWSTVHQRWFFLPRRASKERYEELKDERRATNLMLTASEDFKTVELNRIGNINPTHGFSSFKFIPGTNHNVVVALKSEEDGDKKATYIMVFNIDGTILYGETKIGDQKFEGIGFV